MAKFLITGGAGFIGGTFLLKYVPISRNDSFVCLDIMSYCSDKRIITKLERFRNFKFIKGDICEKPFLENLLKEFKFDYVVNFAAETHVDRSFLNPEVFMKNNVEGVKTLLEVASKNGVKRFHQVSTDEVYGPISKAHPKPFKEDEPTNTTNPYSYSKALADELVQDYAQEGKLETTISRSCNNFGPWQYPEKLIPLVVLLLSNKKQVPLYGDGKQIREWIYVEDHCDAILKILQTGKSGSIYNVGTSEFSSNLETVNKIILKMGANPASLTHINDRPHHDQEYALDSRLIKSLGWSPTLDFDSGLDKTIKWYSEKENQNHYLDKKEYLQWLFEHYGISISID